MKRVLGRCTAIARPARSSTVNALSKGTAYDVSTGIQHSLALPVESRRPAVSQTRPLTPRFQPGKCPWRSRVRADVGVAGARMDVLANIRRK